MIDAAVLLDHPILPEALEAIRPYADLVSFEGIGAGLYGSTARFVARGCSARGRHDEAVDYARRGARDQPADRRIARRRRSAHPR